MNDGLYHKNISLNAGWTQVWGRKLVLRYGNHAQHAANNDRLGAIPLFDSVEFDPSDVVEVEISGGALVKAVLRVPYNQQLDLVYVLMVPQGGVAFVKTVWFNRANDNHKTLNLSAYQRL